MVSQKSKLTAFKGWFIAGKCEASASTGQYFQGFVGKGEALEILPESVPVEHPAQAIGGGNDGVGYDAELVAPGQILERASNALNGVGRNIDLHAAEVAGQFFEVIVGQGAVQFHQRPNQPVGHLPGYGMAFPGFVEGGVGGIESGIDVPTANTIIAATPSATT